MKTGEMIKHARLQAGLTQSQLADAVGTTMQNISQYERSVRNPKAETLKKIASALGVSWYELLSDNPEEQAEAIKTGMKEKLGEIAQQNKPLHKMAPAEASEQPGFHIEFRSDDDHIAYLYSLLNDSGRAEATRCFSRHLDKDAIPEVIEYLQQLAHTPQFQKKLEE